MLCLCNGSPDAVVVERGDVLAEGFPVPSDVTLVRRGPNPASGNEPEFVCASRESVLPEVAPGKFGPDLQVIVPPGGGDENSGGAAGVIGTALRDGDGGAGGAVGTTGTVRGGDGGAGGAAGTTGTAPEAFVADQLYHLVQDEPLISRIHDEELPPDEYYEELYSVLRHKFPEATPELVDHVVPLVAAFDTGAAFSMSFGIEKFQLAQHEVKLVGEYVGEQGRRPNPELVRAINLP